MKKLFKNIFGKKPKRYYINPELAKNQKHLMLITLINAYPNAVATWVFSSPEYGIMNQWARCMNLRRLLKDKDKVKIVTIEKPHTNRYGHSSKLSYYQIADNYAFQECMELNELMLGNETKSNN